MAWRAANSITTLRNQLNELYPSRSKVSDGIIGDAAHAASESQHNPNAVGVVTAFDITTDPQIHPQELADALIQDSRAWYVILNRRIRYNGGQWQPYNGKDPHTSHIHLSVKQLPAQYDNASKWNIEGDEEMAAVEVLESALNAERKRNEILESALNAARKKSDVFESALGASRKRVEELEKETGFKKYEGDLYVKNA